MLDATVEQSVRPTMVDRAGRAAVGHVDGRHGPVGLVAGEAGGRPGRGASWAWTSGVCLLEWAADPGADPTSEAVWWGCMPALGRLADVDTVRQDLA